MFINDNLFGKNLITYKHFQYVSSVLKGIDKIPVKFMTSGTEKSFFGIC